MTVEMTAGEVVGSWIETVIGLKSPIAPPFLEWLKRAGSDYPMGCGSGWHSHLPAERPPEVSLTSVIVSETFPVEPGTKALFN